MIKDAYAEPLFQGSTVWQISLTFDDQEDVLFAKTTSEIAKTGLAKDLATEIALQLRSGTLPISFEVVKTHSF